MSGFIQMDLGFTPMAKIKKKLKRISTQLLTRLAWSISKLFYVTPMYQMQTHQGLETLVSLPELYSLFGQSDSKTSVNKNIYFVTDRDQINTSDQYTRYGVHRGESVSYGISKVSIPSNHKKGRLELPGLFSLKFGKKHTKYFTLSDVKQSAEFDFYSSVNLNLKQNQNKHLLVFVHGFNVSFEESMMQMAQICHDMDYDGVPISYSWPSQGSCHALKYIIDSNNANWSEPNLKTLLLGLLKNTKAEKISIIAHSLGGKILSKVIQELSDMYDTPIFDQIVLAAPDVDAALFRQQMRGVSKIAKQTTLYTCAQDKALDLSAHVHFYQRAGSSKNTVITLPGINTIDVKLLKSSHSYFANEIIDDIRQVVLAGTSPMERSLNQIRIHNTTYWQL